VYTNFSGLCDFQEGARENAMLKNHFNFRNHDVNTSYSKGGEQKLLIESIKTINIKDDVKENVCNVDISSNQILRQAYFYKVITDAPPNLKSFLYQAIRVQDPDVYSYYEYDIFDRFDQYRYEKVSTNNGYHTHDRIIY
jgi:hypothetical protein